MSERGLCSRREADEYISRGLVSVNGQVINELGTKVANDCKITLAAEAMTQQNHLITIMVNKPIGYVSGQPEPGYEPAIRLIKPENQFFDSDEKHSQQKKYLKMGDLKNLAVTGRLDIDSQGLLLFTQDGRVAKKIIGENTHVEKEYLVRVEYMGPEKTLPATQLKLLCHGLSIDGTPLKPAQVEWINDDQLRFILKEGKKRQIRKMCEMVNLKVKGLKRVRLGNLKLGKLPEGQWRFVDPKDIF